MVKHMVNQKNAVSDAAVEDDVDPGDIFAPWDRFAWDNFRELYPEAAVTLTRVIRSGRTPAEISKLGEERGYSPRVIAWLMQAAAHVKRELALQMVEPARGDGRKPILDGEPATGAAPDNRKFFKEPAGR